MRNSRACAYSAILIGVIWTIANGQERLIGPGSDRSASVSKAGNADDLKTIRGTAQAFVAAFNRGEAQAVAALWTEDGDCIDDTGRRFQGRGEIEQVYSAFFREHPGSKIKIVVDSLRLLS